MTGEGMTQTADMVEQIVRKTEPTPSLQISSGHLTPDPLTQTGTKTGGVVSPRSKIEFTVSHSNSTAISITRFQ